MQHRSQTPKFVSASTDQVFKADKIYQHYHTQAPYIRPYAWSCSAEKSETLRLQKHSKTSRLSNNGRVRDGNNNESDEQKARW